MLNYHTDLSVEALQIISVSYNQCFFISREMNTSPSSLPIQHDRVNTMLYKGFTLKQALPE